MKQFLILLANCWKTKFLFFIKKTTEFPIDDWKNSVERANNSNKSEHGLRILYFRWLRFEIICENPLSVVFFYHTKNILWFSHLLPSFLLHTSESDILNGNFSFSWKSRKRLKSFSELFNQQHTILRLRGCVYKAILSSSPRREILVNSFKFQRITQ